MSILAPYAEQHKDTSGPNDSRPTGVQIVEDQGLVGKWTDKVVIVTGCSPGGLGPETARAFHVAGADVYITVRDVAKGEEVAKDILSDGKPGKVEVIKLDLGSLESVREGAKAFLAKSDKLNVIVNNAGVMACPKGKTVDGFETQFGTNHLGHFLLFQLLKSTLLASSTPTFNSRVISVSSSGHRGGRIQFEDFNFDHTVEYHPWAGYGQAKLANILFANELDRRYGARGLHALSLMPGGIETPLQRHQPEITEMIKDPAVHKVMKSPAQGAATSVWAAVAKEWEGKGGKYLEDCAEAEAVKPDAGMLAPGYAPAAFDPEAEKRLWVESLKMVGLEDDQ
ncbi:short-chain dehydrogenase [Colletotrichum lupini]|uniref:Short-chain dehydrogenase n=1 Tax=Colletotrichum lupini TaxID=145971 RepID=A0A9Q8W8L2_9PEZI|nr:short-chain dehydrogenase [Colletotrichum lupini]KAK1703896.1 short-chain dehydrogenase [Colletotrichum lupini]UQC74708.1 short-chain dehydrogenase [Colletotrichum lupini]